MLLLHSSRPLCFHAAGLQQLLRYLYVKPVSSKPQTADPGIPEAWQEGFIHTEPVPVDCPASTTAFSWAKKHTPGLSLAMLGKYFRHRQVRVLQQGKVKRVSRTRPLEPGDIILTPKQQLQEGQSTGSSHSSSMFDAASALLHDGSNDSWRRAVQQQRQLLLQTQQPEQQQQQQQQQQHQRLLQGEQQQQWFQEQQQVEQLVADELALLEQQQPSRGQDGITQQQQQHRHQQRRRRQQQEQHLRPLTVQQIRKSVLASSMDIAILYKPPGVSFHVTPGGSNSDKTPRILNPILAEALNIKPPERPQLICGVDDLASGAVVISRHAAAYEWLSAWAAGEPAAVVAAAATLAGVDSSSMMAAAAAGKSIAKGHRSGQANSPRARQQQQKLHKLIEFATGSSGGGTSAPAAAATAAAGFSVKELQALQQLMQGVGGLRFRRIFWAVVQGDLAVRRSGTLSNRMLRGDEALRTLTRYRVLASRDGLSLLELQPLTNRPNQIRMQCGKVLKTPIVGDYRYGYRPWSSTPSAQPWLSRYLQNTERDSSSSSSRRQQHAQNKQFNPEDLHCENIDEDLDADYREELSDVPASVAGYLPAECRDSRSSSDISAATQLVAEPLLLHCREAVLLRPGKAPVRVIAPLPRSMKHLLHAMEWKQ